MTFEEQRIVELMAHMDEAQRRELLAMARQIVLPRTYTALELLELPKAERERYMALSFALSADEDFETFEAYSEEDIDDDAR